MIDHSTNFTSNQLFVILIQLKFSNELTRILAFEFNESGSL